MKRGMFFQLTMLLMVTPVSWAEVSDVTIDHIMPFANGTMFGTTGAYEIVTGSWKGRLDANLAQNKVINSLNKAPKNKNGKVEYQSRFVILRPVDVSRANNIMLYDVANRGRMFALHWLMDVPTQTNQLETLGDAGNALFLRRGYTLVWSGWEPGLEAENGLLTLTAPSAYQDGKKQPITDMIRYEARIGSRGQSEDMLTLNYPAVIENKDLDELRIKYADSSVFVPMNKDVWHFNGDRQVALLPKGTKFIEGALYELSYTAKDPYVSGIGFAATRDLVSYLRNIDKQSGAPGALKQHSIKYTIAVGISQGGRYLRDFISLGFNQDEHKNKVFDGVYSYIAGAGGIFLNELFSQPGRTHTAQEDRFFPEIAPPFGVVKDQNGLSRFRFDKFDPFWVEVNTSSEYWQKNAALLHVSSDKGEDLTLPDNYRAYLLSGTQHGGQIGLKLDSTNMQMPQNPHNPSAANRALLVALENWLVNGTAMPDNKLPKVQDNSLVTVDKLAFPTLSGVNKPASCDSYVPFGDWRAPKEEKKNTIECLVPQVDQDGNEIAGIRLPDIAVPLATYTGWNLYVYPFPAKRLADRSGGWLPLPLSDELKQQYQDPRASIQERYKDHPQYLEKLREVTEQLVKDGFLLPEDALLYLAQAKSMQTMQLFVQPVLPVNHGPKHVLKTETKKEGEDDANANSAQAANPPQDQTANAPTDLATTQSQAQSQSNSDDAN